MNKLLRNFEKKLLRIEREICLYPGVTRKNIINMIKIWKDQIYEIYNDQFRKNKIQLIFFQEVIDKFMATENFYLDMERKSIRRFNKKDHSDL